MRATRQLAVALLGLVLIVSVASGQIPGLSGSGPTTPKIVHFSLSGRLLERPAGDVLMLTMKPPISLHELIERMKKARTDDAVKAVVVTFDKPIMGFAQLQEVREAIEQLKAADKEVYVHADMMNTGLYCLACSASHVSVVPTGDVWLTGLYSEAVYLRGLLDKIGVEPDFIQMGDYKSAAEPLTNKRPSEKAEEMMNWLFSGLYDSLVGMIANSRGLDEPQVRKIIDNGPYTAEQALEAGLIDSVQHRQDFVADLKERYGQHAKFVSRYGEDEGPDLDFSNLFSAVMSLIDELSKTATKTAKPAVGIVYVVGPIMVGEEEPSPFGGADEARSTSIRKALDEAARDPSIKAVVLRVDSPGGSALASEIIWDATQRVKQKKPFVVSMGNVAASGGYYVSCGADAIFADDATITASIGVIGGKLVTTGMWDKLGVSWFPYQRGENADLFNTSRHFSDKHRKVITDYMDNIYSVFKAHVEQGRGKKLTKPLDEIAGGRVFTGRKALALGLVDRLGSLHDAIKFAADQAKVSTYDVRVLPKPKNMLERLIEMFSRGEKEQELSLGETSGGRLNLIGDSSPLRDVILPLLQEIDPQRARALRQGLIRVQLIHDESVITMMPVDLVIR